EVRPPDRDGARRILQIHLPEGLLYAGSDTRAEMIEALASRLYSPNGDSELATLTFRDNARRVVRARDLVSGRTLEQVCRAVRRAALLRHVRGGEQGIFFEDAEEALAEVLERLSTTLTPGNCRAHLDDLPQDLDVVRVEPIRR